MLGAVGLVAPSAGAGASTPSRCKTSQLALKLVSFQGATGHRFWQLAFVNNGPRCSIKGFPRVVLLDNNGHEIAATIKHESGPVPTVVIASGKRGHFTFSYAAAGFCSHHFLASRLRIFPPKASRGLLFNPIPANHGRIGICTGSEQVSPVRAHPGG
jgi:Protein of unknown function (DUF4232)